MVVGSKLGGGAGHCTEGFKPRAICGAAGEGVKIVSQDPDGGVVELFFGDLVETAWVGGALVLPGAFGLAY